MLQSYFSSSLNTSTEWTDEQARTSPYVYATHPTFLYCRTTMVLVTGVKVALRFMVLVHIENVLTKTDL